MDTSAQVDPNQMLTTEAAADLIGLKASTLAAWREDGSQPDLAFFKVGKAVRYRYRDILAFVESRRASSTVAARQFKVQTPKPSLAARAVAPKTVRGRRKVAEVLKGQLELF